MSRFNRSLTTTALVVALIAPATAMARPTGRDAQGQACKLVAAPVMALKSAFPGNRYLCGKTAYSVSDPTLTANSSPSVAKRSVKDAPKV